MGKWYDVLFTTMYNITATIICVIQDETFLIRDCSKKSNTEPYVLVVYYGRRVYNIKVRFLEDSQQYALGTGLRGDDVSKIPFYVLVYCFCVTLYKFLTSKTVINLSYNILAMLHWSLFYNTGIWIASQCFKKPQVNNLKSNFT